MARFVFAGLMLPATLAVAWLILRRPFREICGEISFEKARERFRQQREHLEAKFVTQASRLDPSEAERWEEARWQDVVVWARDRKTRVLLALVAVEFAEEPFSDSPNHHATAIFEFRRDEWGTEGRGLDEVRPDEAFLLHHRLEPIVVAHRRSAQAGGAI
jgi:hypothetical protein